MLSLRTQYRIGRGARDFQNFEWPPLADFERRFATEEACRDFLFEARWPGGFSCRRCGPADFRWIGTRRIRCLHCHRNTALTGGTILHGTRKPLRDWFYAAYLIMQGGANARAIQERLKLTYKVAWTWAHKLRRLMSLGTTLAAPSKPFNLEWRTRRDQPTGDRQRRIWFAIHGHFQWEEERQGGLGRGGERLMSADWNAPNFVQRLTGVALDRMFSDYSGHMSDKFLRAYMDEAEFRLNHAKFRGVPLLSTLKKLMRRFASVGPLPYFEIRGERPERPPLRIRAPRLETVPVK